jgi:hypothetical protein
MTEKTRGKALKKLQVIPKGKKKEEKKFKRTKHPKMSVCDCRDENIIPGRLINPLMDPFLTVNLLCTIFQLLQY